MTLYQFTLNIGRQIQNLENFRVCQNNNYKIKRFFKFFVINWLKLWPKHETLHRIIPPGFHWSLQIKPSWGETLIKCLVISKVRLGLIAIQNTLQTTEATYISWPTWDSRNVSRYLQRYSTKSTQSQFSRIWNVRILLIYWTGTPLRYRHWRMCFERLLQAFARIPFAATTFTRIS